MPGDVSPGQTAFARMPSGPSSTASICVSITSARFVTEYAAQAVSPQRPASEATVAIEARADDRSAGRQAMAWSKGASTFVASRASHSASLVCESGPSTIAPALSTSASRPPSASQACQVASATCAGSVTSARKNTAPVRPATSAPRSAERPVNATAAPSARSRSTIAAPIPELPPVTNARKPATRATASILAGGLALRPPCGVQSKPRRPCLWARGHVRQQATGT